MNTAERLLQEITDFGYPLLGAELIPDGAFPIIELWDDSIETTRIIAVVQRIEDKDAALAYAESYGESLGYEQAPCGWLCSVAWKPDVERLP